jgi:hypothetical protein
MKNYKQTDLFQDEEALTLSVEDTRVSRFPLPDVKKAKKIRDTSGRNILDSLENSVQVTSLERTWADIFDSVWIPYSRIWTARTTPLGALVLKQRVSVPPTAGNGSSGSLIGTPTETMSIRSERFRKGRAPNPMELAMMFPTPRASDVEGGIVEDVELNNGSFSRRNKKGERWGVKLRDAANYLDKKEKAKQQMWPTPRVSSANGPSQREINEGNPKRRLETEVAIQNMLPTPTARDWKGPRKPETLKKNGRLPSNSLPDKVRSEVKKSEEKLHLNPTWVEGMMGFPHGWTDLGNEESPE